MSEKTIVELKEEDRKLLRLAIDASKENKKLETAIEHKHEEPKDDVHKHFTIDFDRYKKDGYCPDCKTNLDNFVKLSMKNLKEERDKLPFKCDTCGLGVDENEEECVWCGGKGASER